MELMEFEYSIDENFLPLSSRKLVYREMDCQTTLCPTNMPQSNENNNNTTNEYNKPDKSQSPRVSSSTEIFLVKRRPPSMSFRCVDTSVVPPVSKRNERERNRVKLVNMGFQTLRQHIPNGKGKLSKVQTLRSAVDYIRQLQAYLNDDSTCHQKS